jgi:hypothetical protein
MIRQTDPLISGSAIPSQATQVLGRIFSIHAGHDTDHSSRHYSFPHAALIARYPFGAVAARSPL